MNLNMAIGIFVFVLFVFFAYVGCYLLAVNDFSFSIQEILWTATGAMLVTLLLVYKSVFLEAPKKYEETIRAKSLETTSGTYLTIEALIDTFPTKLHRLDGLWYINALIPSAHFRADMDKKKKNEIFGQIFEAAYWKWFSEKFAMGWRRVEDVDQGILGMKSGFTSWDMEGIELEGLDLRKLIIDSGTTNPWILSEKCPWVQNNTNWLGFRVPKGSTAKYDSAKKVLEIEGKSSSLKIDLGSSGPMQIKPLNNRSNFAELLASIIKARIPGLGSLQTHELSFRTHSVKITQGFVPWRRFSDASSIENQWSKFIVNETEQSFGWKNLYLALEEYINSRVVPYLQDRTL